MQGKHIIYSILLVLIAGLSCTVVFAAPPTPPTGFTNPQSVPLDGGLIWLAAVGAFFGAKRMFKGQNK